MNEQVEKHRARKRMLEVIRNLRGQNIVTEMTSKVRVASEQKTAEVYINNTDFHCDENTSDHSDDNSINDNWHDNSDSEPNEVVQLQE